MQQGMIGPMLGVHACAGENGTVAFVYSGHQPQVYSRLEQGGGCVEGGAVFGLAVLLIIGGAGAWGSSCWLNGDLKKKWYGGRAEHCQCVFV